MSIVLSPAFGRDFKSKKAVLEAFDADKDFIIESFDNPFCGKPVNKSQLIEAGEFSVMIRFSNMRKVVPVNLEVNGEVK